MNAHGVRRLADANIGRMADIAVPQRTGPLGLPAQSRPRVTALRQGLPVESFFFEEAAQRRFAEGVFVDSAVEDQGAQDQRGRGRGMLAADVAQQRLLFCGQLLRVAAVAAGLGTQRGQASFFVVV